MMRSLVSRLAGVLWLSGALVAQAQAPASTSASSEAGALRPVATMKQLMVDVIHPASNVILLAVNRGGPVDDSAWAEVRHSAMTLAESANLLIMRNRAPGWVADARLIAEVGAAAYNAAQARDAGALAALADRIDASCTTCHKQFRPTVFPPQ
jgi:hypothetical protein